MTIAKYRPVLTASHIDTILSLCKSSANLTPEVMSVISVLAPFKAKIENAGIVASYHSEPKLNVEQKLGLAPEPKVQSKEERQLVAYTKWKLHGPNACSLTELQDCNEYRATYSLMTYEEYIAYLGSQGIPTEFIDTKDVYEAAQKHDRFRGAGASVGNQINQNEET